MNSSRNTGVPAASGSRWMSVVSLTKGCNRADARAMLVAAAITILCLCQMGCGSAMESGLRAGVAQAKITPPLGVDMAGRAYRTTGVEGVRDDLWCSAVVLDDGETRIAIVALDLLETDYEVDAICRAAVSEATGIAPEAILVNCSHTHSAPAVCGLIGGKKDPEYISTLASLVTKAVSAAVHRLEPAALVYGSAPLELGVCRRVRMPDGTMGFGDDTQGAADHSVQVIGIECKRGDLRAVIFEYACHGVAFGQDDSLVSADWIGEARNAVSRRMRDVVPLFLQGCCGQINPRHEYRGKGMAAGGELAGHAVEVALAKAEPIEGTPLSAQLRRIVLSPNRAPDRSAIAERLDVYRKAVVQRREKKAHPRVIRTLESFREQQERMLRWAEGSEPMPPAPFVVQTLGIGDVGIVGLSGEVFFEFSEAISQQSPFKRNLVLGTSNGCLSYIPTREAFREGGYETDTAFTLYHAPLIDPGAGDEIVTEAVRLLNDLRDGVTSAGN